MIGLSDFKSEYSSLQSEIDTAVKRVLDSGWYVLGKEGDAFESELGTWLGGAHTAGVASGTEAIALALMAVGVKPGDEVILPNVTAFPSITGIVQTGAIPVVVDIDPTTGLLDPSKLSDARSDKTTAILPVHLYGQSVDLDPILTFANQHNLKVVEDCAQSFGATYKGRACGTWGHASAFSFYPTKNLGCYGDGGAVVSKDPAVIETVKFLRNYGQTKRYYHQEPGLNSRLDELQAAILRVKLTRVKSWVQRRQEIAAHYHTALGDRCLTVKDYGDHAYHLFVIKDTNRDALMATLKNQGIGSLIHYPVPISEQEGFSGREGSDLSQSKAFVNEILSLPIHPFLLDEDIDHVTNSIKL